MSEYRTLFIILARGGSKRLPGKNLLCVGGVPLVARAIRAGHQAARRLGNLARVVVSTNDEQIARVARRWLAEVPFMRPAELASDTASSVDAVLHAVDWYGGRGETFTEVVLLQPTSPLRTAEDVVRAVQVFREADGAAVVTVRGHGAESAPYRIASDAPTELNGAVYVCSPQWLRENRRFCVTDKTLAVPLPSDRSIDVDTEADLRMAQTRWEQSLPWRPGRCFIIAEAGVNHNGDVHTALRMIDAAKAAGADAVKFQSFAAERLVTQASTKADYQEKTTSPDESQFEMLRRLALSPEAHETLKARCDAAGIMFLSSPFSEADADLLDSLDVAAIKLGSGEITHHPLLTHVAATMRPVILSTGASTLEEVAAAVEVLRETGCAELALLHCVSSYPADPAEANLRAIETLARTFGAPVGFSDHTLGMETACAAVALGARIIEKHFTLDRSMPGPDQRSSLEPRELAAMVTAIRRVESALGDGVKRPMPGESDVRSAARRSLVAACDMPAGTVLRRKHLAAKRAGSGIPPSELKRVMGMSLSRPLAADEPLTWTHLRYGGGE